MALIILCIYLAGLPLAAYLIPRFVHLGNDPYLILVYPVMPILAGLRFLAELGDEHRAARLRKKTGRGW